MRSAGPVTASPAPETEPETSTVAGGHRGEPLVPVGQEPLEAVRRDAFLEAGGFDDVVFFMGEEERLSLDLAAMGWGLAYVEEVVAHHHPSPVRDRAGRHVRAVRNRLLTAVMRRPWPVVATEVARDLRDPRGRQAVREALPAVPRALAARRRLPPEVEAARRLLD